MSTPIGFASPGDFRRMAKAVFRAESNWSTRGNQAVPDAVPVMSETHVLVQSGPDGNGFYTGKFTYRDVDVTDPANKWYVTDDCLIEEINGKELVAGKRYAGRVYDVREDDPDLPIVEVDSSWQKSIDGGGGTSSFLTTSCNWIEGIDDGVSCWELTVRGGSGGCACCVDKDQKFKMFPDSGKVWLSGKDDKLFTCRGSGRVKLDLSNPCCRKLVILGGGPTSGTAPGPDVTFYFDGCGKDVNDNWYLEFSGGGPLVCPMADTCDCALCPKGTFKYWSGSPDFTTPVDILDEPCRTELGSTSVAQDPDHPCVFKSGPGGTTLTLSGTVGAVTATWVYENGLTYSGAWDCLAEAGNLLTRSSLGTCTVAPDTLLVCPDTTKNPACRVNGMTVRVTCSSCGPSTLEEGCCDPPDAVPPSVIAIKLSRRYLTSPDSVSPPTPWTPYPGCPDLLGATFDLVYSPSPPMIPGETTTGQPFPAGWYCDWQVPCTGGDGRYLRWFIPKCGITEMGLSAGWWLQLFGSILVPDGVGGSHYVFSGWYPPGGPPPSISQIIGLDCVTGKLTTSAVMGIPGIFLNQNNTEVDAHNPLRHFLCNLTYSTITSSRCPNCTNQPDGTWSWDNTGAGGSTLNNCTAQGQSYWVDGAGACKSPVAGLSPPPPPPTPPGPPPPPPPTLVVACASTPAAPFGGALPQTVNFACTPAGGVPPYTYLWTFWGSIPASTSQNPTETFTFANGSAGGHTAHVTVTDSATPTPATAICSVGPFTLG